jgi:hypothetical protein
MTLPDAILQRPPDETKAAATRRAYINGLRQLAAFLEDHPELPCPWAPSHLVGAKDKATLIAIARTPGIRWQKDFDSNEYFSLKATFDGGHVYDVYVPRQEVCRKVVTGTRLEPAKPEQQVEEFHWVCEEPLLSFAAPSVDEGL